MSLPNITIQISADAVAWYGAVIATIAATIPIYNAWRDRPRVVLGFGKNFRRVEAWDEPLFYVSVVNRGRRPVRIDKAWVTVYGYDGALLLPDSFNTIQECILDERNPKITFWTKEDTMNVGNIYRIYVSDDTGKVYKKYIEIFPNFTKLWWAVRDKKSEEVKAS